MVLIVLMIIRFDKKNWSGPVGDHDNQDLGLGLGIKSSILTGGRIRMGDGDTLGMVAPLLINLKCIFFGESSSNLLQGIIVGYAIIIPCILLNYTIAQLVKAH